MDVSLGGRTTFRSLSDVMDIPMISLHRDVHQGELKRVCISEKNVLTPDCKVSRLRHILNFVDSSTGQFKSQFNVIHIDEKWFYITKEKIFYLHPKERTPSHHIQNMNFFRKVMFCTTVAHPCRDFHRKTIFNRKMGIWPFIMMAPAQRNSKNRPEGTLEVKTVNVDRDEMRDMMLLNVIPAIVKKWPGSTRGFLSNRIMTPPCATWGQGDGGGVGGTWSGTIVPAPNIPDLNVLDLGFFNSIQSLKQRLHSKNLDELVIHVQDAFKMSR